MRGSEDPLRPWMYVEERSGAPEPEQKAEGCHLPRPTLPYLGGSLNVVWCVA